MAGTRGASNGNPGAARSRNRGATSADSHGTDAMKGPESSGPLSHKHRTRGPKHCISAPGFNHWDRGRDIWNRALGRRLGGFRRRDVLGECLSPACHSTVACGHSDSSARHQGVVADEMSIRPLETMRLVQCLSVFGFASREALSILMICAAKPSLISLWRGTGCETLVVGLGTNRASYRAG